MTKLRWRVKLVAERETGVVNETELACIERNEQVTLAELGLRLDEAKRVTKLLQAAIVPAQMAALSACSRACAACGRRLAAKGHYGATFRSLFGDVPVQARRWFVCPCQGEGEAKSAAALDFGGDGVAPELACVTARYAAFMAFGKAADFLSALLPLSGTQHASTVRNRTLRVGAEVMQAAESASEPARPASGPVVVGLDGGYVRHRHRAEGRRFEVIAGKVIHVDGAQHRFAFTRTGPAATAEAFRAALAAAGVNANTHATVLCDGDAGLWQLQRKVLPGAAVVLDWWHAAVRFEHALQAARSLGRSTAEASLAAAAARGLERAKWRLWPRALARLPAHGSGFAGPRTGSGSPPCAAGRSAAACATPPAATSCASTWLTCWAASRATRRRSSTTTLAGKVVSRSRPRSWRARSTRSSHGAWPRRSKCAGAEPRCRPSWTCVPPC